MSLAHFEAEVKKLLGIAVTDVDQVIEPGIAYLKAQAPAAAITIGEGVLAGAVAGTPWATLTAALLTQAEAAGIKLAEGAAGVVLNFAQSNLIAKGALPAPAPSAAPAA